MLTNHPRVPLRIEGGTTFHFVTEGFEAGLSQDAAAGQDIILACGAQAAQQYLAARLVWCPCCCAWSSLSLLRLLQKVMLVKPEQLESY